MTVCFVMLMKNATTFFQIGTDAFSVLIQYCTASSDSLRCADEMAMITLASVTGTNLSLGTDSCETESHYSYIIFTYAKNVLWQNKRSLTVTQGWSRWAQPKSIKNYKFFPHSTCIWFKVLSFLKMFLIVHMRHNIFLRMLMLHTT